MQKNPLNKIWEDFAFVPINKATNNIALVCKTFYACYC